MRPFLGSLFWPILRYNNYRDKDKVTMNPGLRSDVALLGMRAMAGAVFLYHGAQKLFGMFGGYGISGTAEWMESIGIPFAKLSATLTGGTELVGGLALLAGFGLRFVSPSLVFLLLVAGFTAHSGFDAASGGREYPLTLAALVAGLGLLGPGRLTATGLRSFASGHEPTAAPQGS